MDALTDPALAEPSRLPRNVEEIIHEKHVAHMRRVNQKGWLAGLLKKAQTMRFEQEKGVKSTPPKKKGGR